MFKFKEENRESNIKKVKQELNGLVSKIDELKYDDTNKIIFIPLSWFLLL